MTVRLRPRPPARTKAAAPTEERHPLEIAAARHERYLEAVVLKALRALAASVPVRDIETALTERGLSDAVALISWEALDALSDDVDVIAATVIAGVKAAAPETRRMMKTADDEAVLGIRFDLINERAVRFAEEQGGRLVREVTDETRRAVGATVARGIREGIPPAQLAREIKHMVGLTTRQAETVANFSRALERAVQESRTADWLRSRYTLSPLRGGQPLSPARITLDRADELTGQYADRLHRLRARNIARTETMRAANEGQLELWRDMASRGLIDPTRARKVWLVTRDDRLCRLCAPMDGRVVGFLDHFMTDVQWPKGNAGAALALTPALTTETPPLHPQCRCVLALEPDEPDDAGRPPPDEPPPWYAKLPPKLQDLPEDLARLVAFPEERAGAVKHFLTADPRSAAWRANRDRLDRFVTESLQRYGLPRGEIKGLRLKQGGFAGYKDPACNIALNRSAFSGASPDDLLKTWTHESLHARSPFDPYWAVEYDNWPGWEESAVEGMAQQLLGQWGLHPSYRTYGAYVEASETLASALGVTTEELYREMLSVPTGKVRDHLMGEIVPRRYEALHGSPLPDDRRARLLKYLSESFGRLRKSDSSAASYLLQEIKLALRPPEP